MDDGGISQPDPFYYTAANNCFAGHIYQLVFDRTAAGIDNENIHKRELVNGQWSIVNGQ